MGLKVEGMDELIKKLEKMSNEAESKKIKKDTVMESAKIVQDEIKKNTPRSKDSKQHAADNIIIRWDEKTEKAIISPHKDYFYLQFLEWGTKNIPANPFMETSFNNVKNNVRKKMSDEIMKRLGL